MTAVSIAKDGGKIWSEGVWLGLCQRCDAYFNWIWAPRCEMFLHIEPWDALKSSLGIQESLLHGIKHVSLFTAALDSPGFIKTSHTEFCVHELNIWNLKIQNRSTISLINLQNTLAAFVETNTWGEPKNPDFLCLPIFARNEFEKKEPWLETARNAPYRDCHVSPQVFTCFPSRWN